MSSQILITGATGFIGRQLTRDLVADGARVRILARNTGKANELFGQDVEICAGDLADTDSIERACRGIETIYHIGGIYRFGLRHRRELWRVNVEGTEHLMRRAAAARVDRIVHLSSGSLLRKKDRTSRALVNEDDFPAEPKSHCSYKSSKWHAEQRVLAWAKKGLPVVIASTTCPIGRGDEAPTPTGQIIRDFLSRQFPFYCRTGLNFIGIGDLSAGLQKVASAGQPGERYLLCDENLWLKEFLDLLALETGLPAPKICLPSALIHLFGYGGEAFDLLNPRSNGARVCLETAVQSDNVQFFSNARAREELGWRPASTIQANIGEAIAWFRDETKVELVPAASSSI